MKSLSRHYALAKAFVDILNQWSVLTYYAVVGWVEADINLAENVLRIFSLSQEKLWFFGAEH